ncbi:hypothetical protein LWF15_26780 [Kineosporia rhizophila]|uniref:hypothetical protein n=1 Tax=Kineosporia rhizophila TaxID=84633 RepID=UPI001E5DABAC|nr:hypothetical protein [Kineosporia rhizophila]MCE0539111.1 hypothetical protein [Kineosporia rhizophila]
MGELDGVTVVVTGSARGFGRAVEEAMTEAGAEVVGAGVACGEELLRLHRPELLVITSTSLDGTDRRLDPSEAFDWAAAALRVAASGGGQPATVFAVSGEPVEAVEPVASTELIDSTGSITPMKLTETVGLTGSAAGATSAGVEAFSHSLEPLAAYVAWEAQHLGVHLRFVCVLVPPGDQVRLVHRFRERAGGIGRSAWSSVAALVAGLGPVLTELELGSELVRLAALAAGDPLGRGRTGAGDGERLASAYLLGADGVVPISG